MRASPSNLPRRPGQEDLAAVDLVGADLRGFSLQGRDLSGRDLRGARLADAELAGARLAGADLREADLSDCDLAGADFSGADLRGALFTRARGAGARMAGARLDEVDLSGAVLPGLVLTGATGEGVRAVEARLQELDARDAVLPGLRAPGAALDLGRLDGAALEGARLDGATLEGSALAGARLAGAVLARARLHRADLQSADLRGARLDRARLQGARVAGALLEGVSARRLAHRGVAWTAEQAEALRKGGAQVGPGALERGARAGLAWLRAGGPFRLALSLFTAIGWPLARAYGGLEAVWGLLGELAQRLKGVAEARRQRLAARQAEGRARREALVAAAREDAELDAAQPAPAPAPAPSWRARLSDARASARRGLGGLLGRARALVGTRVDRRLLVPGADLSGVDLRRADLSGLDLRGARLRNAFLDGADLRGTLLEGARLDGARLRGARLQGADLRGASAIEAALDEARLDGARLDRLQAAGARLPGAVFAGASLGGAGLAAADLTGASLVDCDLTGVDLSGALLDQADLSGARLEAATVRGAELGGALGLSPSELEALRRRGADLGGLVGAGPGLAELRAFARGLGRAALLGASWTLGRVDALRRAALGLGLRWTRAAFRASVLGLVSVRASAKGFVEELSRSAAERRELEQALGSTRLPPRAPGRALGGVLGRMASDVVRGLGLAGWELGRGLSGALSAALRGAARAALTTARAVARGASRAGAASARARVAAVPAARRLARDFALGAASTFRLARVALVASARAVATGAVTAARGLEALSTGLERAATRTDARLDAAALRTEALARSGVEGLRRLPAELPGLGARLRAFPGTAARGAARVLRRLAGALRDGVTALGQALVAAGRGTQGLAEALFAALRGELGALRGATRRLTEELGRLGGAGIRRLEAVAEGRAAEDPAELLQVVREGRARRPAHEAPSRLAGLVTLAAALVLSLYLGRQFLEGRTAAPDQVEALAVDDAARGETGAALSRYEALLEGTQRPSDRALLRWQMASVLLDAGQREAALAQLQQAVQEVAGEPDDEAEAWLRLAEVLGSLGDFEGERAACEQALAVEGAGSALAGRALARIIASHKREGDAAPGDARVQAWLAEAVVDPARDVAVRAALAERLVASGDPDRAVAALAELEGRGLPGPQEARRLAALAAVHEARGAGAAALEVHERLAAEHPRALAADPELLLAAAGVAHRQGRVELASRWLDLLEGVEQAPRVAARADLLRARMAREAGRPNTAALLYQRVLTTWPDDEETVTAAQLALAETLPSLDDPDAAEALYSELLATGDEDLVAQVQVGRARSLARQGEVDAARDGFEAVLAASPEGAAARAARMGLAELELESGNTSEAIRWLREQQAEGGAGVEIDAAIADVLLRAGRFDEAELAWGRLAEGAAPGSEAEVVGRLGLARLAEARGQREAARAGYEAVLAMAPDPVLASQALAALAGLHLDAGEDDEAMAAWQATLRSLPEGHPAVFDTRLAMADILRRRGDPARARGHVEALLAGGVGPEQEAALRVVLAELLEAEGRPAEARVAWEGLLGDPALPASARDDVVVGLTRSTLALGEAAQALALAEAWRPRVLEASTAGVLTELQAQALRGLGREAEAQALGTGGAREDDPLSRGMAEAAALGDAGDWEGAVAGYEGLIGLAEDEVTRALLTLRSADTLAAAGELDRARAAYVDVLRRWSGLDEARFGAEMGLASLDRLAGQPEAAARRYLALRGPDPGSEVWRIEQLAEAWTEAGDLDAAEAAYKALIQEHPGDPAAQAAGRRGLAELRRAEGDLATARALLHQVARMAPDPGERAWARLDAAMILVDEGRLDEAEAALEALVDSEDPELALSARVGLSSVLLERDSARAALRLLDEVEAAGLGTAWEATLTQQRAACLVAMGEPEQARALWRALARAHPEDGEVQAQVRLALGDLSFGSDDFGAALADYRAVLDTARDRHYQARALLGLARALEALGRAEEARAAYLELVEDYGEQDELVAIAEAALAG